METSRRILRGDKVEGLEFCHVPFESIQEKLEKPKEEELESYRQGLQDGYETGKSEGLDIGFKHGIEKSREELKSSIILLNTIAAAFRAKQEEAFEQAKPEIINFSITICEAMLRSELSKPKVFQEQIKRLLIHAKEILKDVSIDVVVSPEDWKMLEQSLSTSSSDIEDLRKVNFIADKTMEKGNCRLETSLGLVNFDVKRHLNDLERRLLEKTPE